MDLKRLKARIVLKEEEERFNSLLTRYHYLGSVPKIGKTIWYVATLNENWVALASFSVPALKVKARDQWIGWDFRHQTGRLRFLVNNNRFLILPDTCLPYLGSKALSLFLRRLNEDWVELFGYRVLLVETFVDPKRFQGTVYKACNWLYVGNTKGYSRANRTYERTGAPKLVFVRALHRHARTILSQPLLNEGLANGRIRMTMKAEQMKALPDFFSNVTDPRRAEGKRHPLKTILALATAAILCGARGYKGIYLWSKDLGEKARQRFNCRKENGKSQVPSEYVIRDVLIRVDPAELDQSFQAWNSTYAVEDASLAMDGKTMCSAIDDQGRQTHIMSLIGHDSALCHTQKKSV